MRLLHTVFAVIWLVLTSQHAVAQQNYNKEYGNIIRTMSVERMRITSSGLVGIGTATPTTAFQVSGSVMFTNNSTSAPAFYVSSTSGYVGIGTSVPSATLHVAKGDSGFNGALNGRTVATFESSLSGGAAISILGPSTGMQSIYFGNGSTMEAAGQIQYSAVSDSLLMSTGGSAYVIGFRQGKLLIGSGAVDASTTLHVSGTVRLADGGESCDSNRTGAIKYASGDFSVCRNGSAWETLTTIGAASSAVDRISTSGVASGATLGAVVASQGTVSFTLGGTAGAAYLDTSARLVAAGVSTTGNVAADTVSVTNNMTVGGDFSVSGTSLYVSRTTGYVGMGTTMPSATLHVARSLGNGTATIMASGYSAGISTIGQPLWQNWGMQDSTNSNAEIFRIGTTNSIQTWMIRSSNSYPIDIIGGRGVGITAYTGNNVADVFTPSQTLHVKGTALTTSWTGINFSSYANVTPTAPLEVSGTVSATRFVGDGSQLTGIVASSAATDRISTSGVVSGATLGAVVADRGTVSFTLAGTAGAAYLHPTLGFVGPGVSTTGPVSATNLYSSGDIVWIGEAYDVSDRRMKENIEAFADGTLARLEQLKPVSFRMISGSGRTEYGFIAQDVEPVFPELVKPGMPYTLNMVGMIAPTIKAVQELAAENRALRQTVASQAERIRAMEAANDNFERRLQALEGR